MLIGIREHNTPRSNQNSQLVMTLIQEGRPPCRHLVQQYTKRPPVNTETVTTHIKNLGSQILCCTTEGEGLITGLQELSKAKISQTNVAIIVHKNVFRF